MTREEAKWAIANPKTLKAMADGDVIEVRVRGIADYTWTIAVGDSLNVSRPGSEWRKKPEPKLRPWKPEEVPVGARYRAKGRVDFCQTILGFCPDWVTTSASREEKLTYSVLLEHCEYSPDDGSTWLPCGVAE